MGQGRACLECTAPSPAGIVVLDQVVCRDCWDVLLRTATSTLGDRVMELLGPRHRIHPMAASRAVAAALPTVGGRLRVLIELRARGLGPQRSSGKRSPELLALVSQLRAEGVPGTLLGQFRLSTGSEGGCAQCGKDRSMGGRLDDGNPLCTRCWRIRPDVLAPCIRCGGTHYLSRDGLCRGCRSRDKVNALFSAERLAARPELIGIRDALLAADGAYLYGFMKKTTSSWNVLRRLVAGNGPITHDAVDAASRPGTSLLRSFLVATGVLPQRNERLVAFETWIDRTALSIVDEADRRIYLGFARWRHLRRARQHTTLTCAQAAGHRRQLTYVRNFLSTLHARGMTMSTASQAVVDAWLADGPPERACVRAFVHWCRANGINQNLTVTSPRPNPLPAVLLLPERQHHALLARVLDPDQRIDPALRLAASLVLLYGIRNHELAALSLASIITTAEGVWIRFGTEPLHLPAGLAGYARKAVSERSVTRLGRTTEDHQWLFPGLFPNQPIDPRTLSLRLAALGVKPEKTRSTALGQLAQQLPPPILARLTGVSAATAVRWSAAVAASYARNLPPTQTWL